MLLFRTSELIFDAILNISSLLIGFVFIIVIVSSIKHIKHIKHIKYTHL